MQKISFNDMDPKTWDGLVSKTEDASFHHSWNFLRYLQEFPNVTNKSYALFDDHKKLIAIVPVGITVTDTSADMSFSGSPCGVPAFVCMRPSKRRKYFDVVMGQIRIISNLYKTKKVTFVYHPINIKTFSRGRLPLGDSFQLQRYNCFYSVFNTLVIDLSLPVDELKLNMSKYRRRTINKSIKSGMRVEVYNKLNNFDSVNDMMDLFQREHLVSSGRSTRPQKTWDVMKDSVLKGYASLFVIFVDDDYAGFLMCGEFEKMAFGWSQVNVEKYEKKYSPRHLLEWWAICYYKDYYYYYYDIGDRFYNAQMFYKPSLKEVTISEFKERYGAIQIPKIIWYRYFDTPQLKKDIRNNCNNMIESYCNE
jgi:hypothetical protein